MIRTFDLTKQFGAVTALEPLSLEIAEGEFFALLGASGSGKTTLLRLLGGFEWPTAGRIMLDGQDVTHLQPYRRPTNTVFQSYALFPHLSLTENVGYGLLNLQLSGAERQQRVDRALARVRLQELGNRYPHQISGGQRQRVALARALVCKPKVLLLDEPLGALDKRLREELQVELREIQREEGITFVHVTHDQEEAMALADRVAIMAGGRLLQVATPRVLYESPACKAVAQFISNVNLFEGKCLARSGSVVRIVLGRAIEVLAHADGAWPRFGDLVIVALRPEKLRVGNPAAGDNSLSGRLIGESYAGDRTHFQVAVVGLDSPVMVTMPNTERALLPISWGPNVTLSWHANAAVLLES